MKAVVRMIPSIATITDVAKLRRRCVDSDGRSDEVSTPKKCEQTKTVALLIPKASHKKPSTLGAMKPRYNCV
jgi:hypothetical protein